MPPGSATLEACGDVDAVAVNLLAVDHHVAEVHADAKFHPALGRQIRVFALEKVLWISTAHWTAFTTLANSASTLSPAELTKRP